jgi:phosphate transport system permease protein
VTERIRRRERLGVVMARGGCPAEPQTGLTLLLVVPLGLLTAIFLDETRSRLRRPVRIMVNAMSGLPSIVAGLFVYATLIIPGIQAGVGFFSYSGFMATLALTMVMLPTVTRTIDVVLRLVPDGLREASLALGASRARTVWSVLLPTARTGVTTAVILGVARVAGETAPLLFTSFGAVFLRLRLRDRLGRRARSADPADRPSCMSTSATCTEPPSLQLETL